LCHYAPHFERKGVDVERKDAASRISTNAFARLIALYEEEVAAAKVISGGDGYPDFFVEGSGPPWHEYFPDVIGPDELLKQVSGRRMAYVDRIRQITEQDGYSDFFVEGGGPPWHEAFGDFIEAGTDHWRRLSEDPLLRMKAAGRLSVFAAYRRLQERT
jgi:hypothetical protein